MSSAKDSIPLALCLGMLAVLLCLSLEADAEDEINGQQRNNYAVAPIVVSNPPIGSGAGATGMFFYDVGSDRDAQPRSSVQLVGAYTHTDSYFVGLMNSLHVLQDQVRSKAGLFHATINNEYRDPLGGEADFSPVVMEKRDKNVLAPPHHTCYTKTVRKQFLITQIRNECSRQCD